jgi:C4-dicarboxylate transporter DctM subunit
LVQSDLQRLKVGCYPPSVSFAGIFTWTASVIGVIDRAAELIIGVSSNAVVMIIPVNVLLPILSLYLPVKAGLYLPGRPCC